MDRLKRPLSDITEDGITINEVIPAQELIQEGAPEGAFEELSLSGTLTQISSQYLFRGTLTSTLEHPCDRCLEIGRQTLNIKIAWLFQPVSEAGRFQQANEIEEDQNIQDDELVHHFEGNKIDLAIPLVEELMLAVQAKFLCKQECAGLCPNCGVNLNRGPCQCPTPEPGANTGLAALADMFPNLHSKPSEN